MIIAGVDPASRNTGFAVIDASKDKPIILKRVTITAKQSNAEERLVDIYWDLSKLFKRYQPDYVGIESQYLRQNPSTLKLLAFSAGVAWASALANTNAEIQILDATKWRKLLLGKGHGKAKKDDVVKYLVNQYNLPETGRNADVDSFEALGIALAVLNSIKKVPK